MSHTPDNIGDLLREALPVYEAPESLKAFAREHAARELAEAPVARRANWSRLLIAASLAATFAGGWWAHDMLSARARMGEQDAMTVAVVDTHIHSLMSGHVMDVTSSDQHTVKPWFAGKVPLAPAVPELSAGGFPLLGGRVESIAGHQAAAITYGKARHLITLYIWTTPDADAGMSVSAYHGYSTVHWNRAGLAYWAASDVNATDLQDFAAKYIATLTPGKPYP